MKRLGLTVVLIILIVALLLGIGYSLLRRGSILPGSVIKDSGSNISDYSAVFLTNGQVYFGQVKRETDKEIDLTDIYYLQVSQQNQQLQPTSSPNPNSQPNIVLVKLGDELHGPNDQMHINHDQVLFIESMKSDSKVVKAIDDYKAGKK